MEYRIGKDGYICLYSLTYILILRGSGEFMTCNIGEDTLEAYKANKFGIWKSECCRYYVICGLTYAFILYNECMYAVLCYTHPAAQ